MTRTHWLTWLGAIASSAALGIAESGCSDIDCGTGTLDKDGTCVPTNDTFGNATCGTGTHVGTGGQCVADNTVVCDPATTMPVVDPNTGVTTCVGVGTTGCGQPIACSKPSSGKMTICGQLFDLETSATIAGTSPTGTPCDPKNPTASGPCSLTIAAYDALAFAGNPTGTTPLNADSVTIDDCGRFAIKNIVSTGTQFVGIGLDDSTVAPATDMHRLTGIATPTQGGELITEFPVYGMLKTTDSKWTTQAGLSGGTFVDRGVWVGIFLHGTTPISGVTATRGGDPSPPDDYYFSDTSPASRATVDTTLDATGADGTALLINGGGLTQYSGTGGEPSGCSWPTPMGAEIQNVAFVEPEVAVTTNSTNNCP